MKKLLLAFLWQWWKNRIATQPYFDHEAFTGIYKITGDLDRMLECWETDFLKNGFRVLVDFIDHYYFDLIYEGKNFKDLKEDDIKKSIPGLERTRPALKKDFFILKIEMQNLPRIFLMHCLL
jgi:hypothetical protein